MTGKCKIINVYKMKFEQLCGTLGLEEGICCFKVIKFIYTKTIKFSYNVSADPKYRI